MIRNIKSPAIVLKSYPVGEHHRGLTLMLENEGLIRPIAFGARSRRSAFRATAVPYNRGIADLRFDGAGNKWKLNTFDSLDTHDGLRENLNRFYSASLWAEVLLHSHGGGQNPELFDLAVRGFRLLSHSSETGISWHTTLILWEYLRIEGVKPDILTCSGCDLYCSPDDGKQSMRYTENGVLYCTECGHSGTELSNHARRWLGSSASLPAGNISEPEIPPSVCASASQWVLILVQSILERPLKSLWSTNTLS